MSISKLLTAIKGGSGSGNFGHGGRPGKIGGSASDGGMVGRLNQFNLQDFPAGAENDYAVPVIWEGKLDVKGAMEAAGWSYSDKLSKGSTHFSKSRQTSNGGVVWLSHDGNTLKMYVKEPDSNQIMERSFNSAAVPRRAQVVDFFDSGVKPVAPEHENFRLHPSKRGIY